MKDYIKPTLRMNPDHVIIYNDTNDLNNDTEAKQTAESIVDVAQTIKSDKRDVILSSILPRNEK